MTRRIGCFGGVNQPEDPAYRLMNLIGYLIATKHATVITGMEAVARGARRVPGAKVIGYSMSGRPGNNALTTIVDCSQYGCVRLSLEGQYCRRLKHLLKCDGFIFGPNVSRGTKAEAAEIINLNASSRWNPPKPIVFLGSQWATFIETYDDLGPTDCGGGVSWLLMTDSPTEAVGHVMPD